MTEEQYDLIYGAGAAKALANSQSWSNRGTTPARLKEISNMNWKEANALEKTQAFDKTYKGKDAVSKSNYIKQGLQSLFGKYTPGSNVGGGTALTQKIFQNPVLKSLINNPVAKTAARTANFLGTPALAYGVGDLAYNLTDKAINTNFADNIGLGRKDLEGYGSSLFNLINPNADTNYGSANSASSFNSGNINVEDYSTTQQRVQAERASQAQAQAAAKQQQILADQTRMQQGQTSTPVLPAPVKQTVINTPSNQTKFGANRSTAIKGGRGARGNYNKPAASSPAPVFKSYGPPNMQRFR